MNKLSLLLTHRQSRLEVKDKDSLQDYIQELIQIEETNKEIEFDKRIIVLQKCSSKVVELSDEYNKTLDQEQTQQQVQSDFILFLKNKKEQLKNEIILVRKDIEELQRKKRKMQEKNLPDEKVIGAMKLYDPNLTMFNSDQIDIIQKQEKAKKKKEKLKVEQSLVKQNNLLVNQSNNIKTQQELVERIVKEKQKFDKVNVKQKKAFGNSSIVGGDQFELINSVINNPFKREGVLGGARSTQKKFSPQRKDLTQGGENSIRTSIMSPQLKELPEPLSQKIEQQKQGRGGQIGDIVNIDSVIKQEQDQKESYNGVETKKHSEYLQKINKKLIDRQQKESMNQEQNYYREQVTFKKKKLQNKKSIDENHERDSSNENQQLISQSRFKKWYLEGQNRALTNKRKSGLYNQLDFETLRKTTYQREKVEIGNINQSENKTQYKNYGKQQQLLDDNGQRQQKIRTIESEQALITQKQKFSSVNATIRQSYQQDKPSIINKNKKLKELKNQDRGELNSSLDQWREDSQEKRQSITFMQYQKKENMFKTISDEDFEPNQQDFSSLIKIQLGRDDQAKQQQQQNQSLNYYKGGYNNSQDRHSIRNTVADVGGNNAKFYVIKNDDGSFEKVFSPQNNNRSGINFSNQREVEEDGQKKKVSEIHKKQKFIPEKDAQKLLEYQKRQLMKLELKDIILPKIQTKQKVEEQSVNNNESQNQEKYQQHLNKTDEKRRKKGSKEQKFSSYQIKGKQK